MCRHLYDRPELVLDHIDLSQIVGHGLQKQRGCVTNALQCSLLPHSVSHSVTEPDISRITTPRAANRIMSET